MDITTTYTPMPGFILILPFDTDTNSEFKIVDNFGKTYKGEVIAVGKDRLNDYGINVSSPVRVGDKVLYSIAGAEKTKLEYGGKRTEFAIAPFGRILLKIEESNRVKKQ